MQKTSRFICKNGEGDDRRGFMAALPEGSGAPEWFQVFPYGLVEIEGGGTFLVDEEAMRNVVARFRARGLDMVVDYEHQTEGNDKAPAAGWIRELEARGTDGLWARVEWTDEAAGLLARREYRYYSPVFYVGKEDGRLVELLRVALTNAPRLNWIRPIVAKRETTEEGDMEYLKRLAKILHLPETAGEEDVLKAVTAKCEAQQPPAAPVAAKEVLEALGLPETAGRSEVVATIHAMRQKPDLTAEVAKLRRELACRTRDELVAAALKEGKIAPAQREWAENYALSDPEGFRLFLAKAPVVVPVGDLRPATDPKGGGTKADETQLQINKMLGVSREAFEKYGKGDEA